MQNGAQGKWILTIEDIFGAQGKERPQEREMGHFLVMSKQILRNTISQILNIHQNSPQDVPDTQPLLRVEVQPMLALIMSANDYGWDCDYSRCSEL